MKVRGKRFNQRSAELLILRFRIQFDNVSDIIDILMDSCGKWTSISNRILSVVMYLTMRLCNLQFEETRLILEKLKLLNIKCCHSWLKTIIAEDYLCVLLKDNRCAYKRQLFYELYPEIESQAKSYALERLAQVFYHLNFLPEKNKNFTN
jgi:hypothetical protein